MHHQSHYYCCPPDWRSQSSGSYPRRPQSHHRPHHENNATADRHKSIPFPRHKPHYSHHRQPCSHHHNLPRDYPAAHQSHRFRMSSTARRSRKYRSAYQPDPGNSYSLRASPLDPSSANQRLRNSTNETQEAASTTSHTTDPSPSTGSHLPEHCSATHPGPVHRHHP